MSRLSTTQEHFEARCTHCGSSRLYAKDSLMLWCPQCDVPAQAHKDRILSVERNLRSRRIEPPA